MPATGDCDARLHEQRLHLRRCAQLRDERLRSIGALRALEVLPDALGLRFEGAVAPLPRVLLEERGSRRLSSQTVVDLRLSKAMTLKGASRVEFGIDVLNLLNDTAEESIVSDRFDAAVVGNVFLDPRRVMFSVKMSIGK